MNRNKLIDKFISNLANAVLHELLEKAIDKTEIAEKYNKEILNSWTIAKNYREKINPVNLPLPERDIQEIQEKIINKVKNELLLRISRGYKNLDLSLVEDFVIKALRNMGVID